MTRLALLLLSSAVSLLFLEGAAQIYATWIAGQGRLFTADPQLGWRPRANLDLVRRGPTGRPWRIRTDGEGLRSARPRWERGEQRVVVLGDSFAFGEPVDEEQRFDARFLAAGIVSLNLGVPGFGTGQEFLRFESVDAELRPGDSVLLLTYRNDFHDLLRARHSGRVKPRFTLDAADPRGFRVALPVLGPGARLRNVSYLFARAAALLEAPEPATTDAALEEAARLYEKIVGELGRRARARGASLLVVFHGLDATTRPTARAAQRICASQLRSLRCLDLERDFTRASHPDLFYPDGHWTPAGHERAGLAMLGALQNARGLAAPDVPAEVQRSARY